LHDLVCPEAQHAPAFSLQISGTPRVGLLLESAMVAVDLDDELSRDTGKVREVGTDGMLPTEFGATNATTPQEFPHLLLGAAAVSA
jgi:hypothetical protein